MVYHLGVDPTYWLVKKKKWSFALEQEKTIIKGMDKLIKASFAREVIYPTG